MHAKQAERIIAKVLDGKFSVVDGAEKLTEAYPGLSLNDAGLIVGEAYYGDAGFVETMYTAMATLRDVL